MRSRKLGSIKPAPQKYELTDTVIPLCFIRSVSDQGDKLVAIALVLRTLLLFMHSLLLLNYRLENM